MERRQLSFLSEADRSEGGRRSPIACLYSMALRQEIAPQFFRLRCMATGTSLVGNSKVMAHALPNLVAPVDREYTLRFLFGRTNIANDLESEWAKLQVILRDFFYPIARAESFKLKVREWQERRAEFRWDTSPLKTADNLVIGLLKSEGVDERAPGTS